MTTLPTGRTTVADVNHVATLLINASRFENKYDLDLGMILPVFSSSSMISLRFSSVLLWLF